VKSILRREYNKFSDQEVKDLRYVIEIEVESYIEHESIVGIKTPLDTVSITLWDNWRDGQKEKTTLALNKGKRDYLNVEDFRLKGDLRSKDKGKMP